MRVTFVVVVLAFAAAGCEKTPPVGESGKQLAPAGEGTAKPGAAAPAPTNAREEPEGEPMDDVDEAESPSDKSGAADPDEAVGDEPTGEERDVEE